MSQGRQECATRVIETIPLVMRTLGAELERRGHRGLSMRRVRTLRFLSIHRGSNLTDLCFFLDATLSAGSKLVDGLVRDGLLAAEASQTDRRVKRISITAAGRKALGAIDRQLSQFLGERLADLSEADCVTIGQAMYALLSVFRTAAVPSAAGGARRGEGRSERCADRRETPDPVDSREDPEA